MVIGEIPFTAGNQKTLEENIVTSKLKIPSYVSPECSSLLKGLLSKRVYSRITCLKDLRSSDFLKKHLNTS
ncbi:hypothetical protein DFH28DRAFT_948767 [Melampsora americana]|nr:hypothetical protein DFH28DRAFT_948767 [Melampsora americana]